MASDGADDGSDIGRGGHHGDRSEPETAYCPDCGQVVEVEGHFSEGQADE